MCKAQHGFLFTVTQGNLQVIAFRTLTLVDPCETETAPEFASVGRTHAFFWYVILFKRLRFLENCYSKGPGYAKTLRLTVLCCLTSP